MSELKTEQPWWLSEEAAVAFTPPPQAARPWRQPEAPAAPPPAAVMPISRPPAKRAPFWLSLAIPLIVLSLLAWVAIVALSLH